MSVVLFTHNADIDGMGAAVLAKMIFGEDLEVVFSTPHTINDDFVKRFNIKKIYDDDLEESVYDIFGNEELYKCDNIYITDLAITGELLNRIGRCGKINAKFGIFDHHEFSKKMGVNNYLFSKIKIEDEKGLCSGTSIFYEYLLSKRLIDRSTALDSFVELIRRQDTWEWKTKYNDLLADDLAQLFNAIGKERFIDSMVKKLINNPEKQFELSEEEKKIVSDYKKDIEDACEACLKDMYVVEKDGVRFGIGNITYKFRNEIAEYVRSLNLPIDVLALPNYEAGSCSFRSINENVDVNEIAMNYGGGGHKCASSCPINKDLSIDFGLKAIENQEDSEPNC